MKRRSAIGIALLTSVVLAGCAALSWKPAKYCGETQQNAVMTFLGGAPELGVQVIADDGKHGGMATRTIIDHPEVRKGNKARSTYYVTDMTTMETSERWVKRWVSVHREDQFLDKEQRWEEQLYSKLFTVKFAPEGNCILELTSTMGWSRLK